AEGQVRLDNSVEIQDGQKALLDLNTRGEFRVRGHRGKVQKKDGSREPIVARAKSVGLGGGQGPVVPASLTTPQPTKPALAPSPPPAVPPSPFLPPPVPGTG